MVQHAVPDLVVAEIETMMAAIGRGAALDAAGN
jgi:hypothetical protein